MAGTTSELSPGGLFSSDTTTQAGSISESAASAATDATAEQSQIAASASETAAAASATTASTKASEASTSATNAASSATTASGHATTATTKASEASSSASTASGHATTATTKASEAATSASTATTQASNSATSATAANTAKVAAEAALDQFTDVYLGAFSSDPTVDNDGDALTTGDQYFNTASNVLKIYNGSSWQAAALDNTQFVEVAGDTMTGNLSFGDDDKAIFGAGPNLQIYYNGTHSYIEDAGSGDLILKASDQIKLQNGSGQNMAIFNENGAVVLTHSEDTKLATTSTGIDVTGTVESTVSTTGDNNFQAISTGGGQYRIYPDDATTANPTWLHQSNSSEEQAWVIGGVERMRIDSSGHAIIPAGVTLGTAAGVYNADKTLDDYEEGTWTPVISDGTNDATPNIAVGTYTKVGNLVHVQGRIVLSSLGSVSGAVQLKGLPFNSKALSNNFGVLVVGRASLLNRPAGLKVSGDLRSNVDYVNLILNDTNSGTSNMQSTEFTDDGDIAFSMQYITA